MRRFDSLQLLVSKVNLADYEFHQDTWFTITNPAKWSWTLNHNHHGNSVVQNVLDSRKEYRSSTALRYALLSILVERLAAEKYHEKHERGTA